MGKLIPSLLMLLLLSGPAFGQDKEAEHYFLRQALSVPSDAPIKNVSSSTFPNARPLKVYLAIDEDAQIQENLIKWMDEWNKSEGAQFGTIEIVSHFYDADVALVRFREGDNFIDDIGGLPTHSIIKPGSAPGSIEENEPSRLPNHVKITEVAYSYIVVRNPSIVNVLYSSLDTLFKKTTYYSEQKSTKEVWNKLKKELKAELSKRSSGTNKEKDAKFNGHKLCEQLFKLMRARSKQK